MDNAAEFGKSAGDLRNSSEVKSVTPKVKVRVWQKVNKWWRGSDSGSTNQSGSLERAVTNGPINVAANQASMLETKRRNDEQRAKQQAEAAMIQSAPDTTADVSQATTATVVEEPIVPTNGNIHEEIIQYTATTLPFATVTEAVAPNVPQEIIEAPSNSVSEVIKEERGKSSENISAESNISSSAEPKTNFTLREMIKAGKWDIAAVGIGFAGRAIAVRLGMPPETIGMVLKIAGASTGLIAAAEGALEMRRSRELAGIPLSETAERAQLENHRKSAHAIRVFFQKITAASIGAGLDGFTESQMDHFVDTLGHPVVASSFDNPSHTASSSIDQPHPLPNITEPGNGHVEPGTGYNDLPVTPQATSPVDSPPLDQPIAYPGHPGLEPGDQAPTIPVAPQVSLETLASQIGNTQIDHIDHDMTHAATPPEVPVTSDPNVHITELGHPPIESQVIDHATTASGHVLDGQLDNLDNPLPSDGMKLELHDGVRQINHLLQITDQPGEIDQKRLVEVLRSGTEHLADKTLVQGTPEWKVLTLCDGTKDLQAELQNPQTVQELRDVGILH